MVSTVRYLLLRHLQKVNCSKQSSVLSVCMCRRLSLWQSSVLSLCKRLCLWLVSSLSGHVLSLWKRICLWQSCAVSVCERLCLWQSCAVSVCEKLYLWQSCAVSVCKRLFLWQSCAVSVCERLCQCVGDCACDSHVLCQCVCERLCLWQSCAVLACKRLCLWQVTQQRVLAFIKRLTTMGLHQLPQASAAYLATTRCMVSVSPFFFISHPVKFIAFLLLCLEWCLIHHCLQSVLSLEPAIFCFCILSLLFRKQNFMIFEKICLKPVMILERKKCLNPVPVSESARFLVAVRWGWGGKGWLSTWWNAVMHSISEALLCQWSSSQLSWWLWIMEPMCLCRCFRMRTSCSTKRRREAASTCPIFRSQSIATPTAPSCGSCMPWGLVSWSLCFSSWCVGVYVQNIQHSQCCSISSFMMPYVHRNLKAC